MESEAARQPAHQVDSFMQGREGWRSGCIHYARGFNSLIFPAVLMHSGARTLTLSGDVAFPVHGTLDKTSHWRELKSFVATNTCLSRQNTSFVATKVYLPRQNYVCREKLFFFFFFVATKLLSRQKTRVHRDKSKLLVTKDVFCPDKHVFVETKLLSPQKRYLWQLP